MKIETRYKLLSLFYLIGCPILGAGIGVVFYFVLGVISGNYSPLGREVSIAVWSAAGLYIGICGFLALRKMHLRYRSNVSSEKNHNKRL